ncbi:MAG: response regulator [Bacteroidia bacterium]
MKPKLKVNSALIIDDEIDICILLKNYLNRKNTTATFSTTLKDGIKKLKEEKPDLLILDHNLPDGHGIDMIKQIKRDNKSLFIIVISAMSNLKTTAINNGADFFLEKPISFSLLNEILPQ